MAHTMSRQKEALVLRDLAIAIVKARGTNQSSQANQPGQAACIVFEDERFKISYCECEPSQNLPHALDIWKRSTSAITEQMTDVKVLGVIWNDDGNFVVVIHRPGAWEQGLRRLAGKLCSN
jgi:hypothetical protein